MCSAQRLALLLGREACEYLHSGPSVVGLAHATAFSMAVRFFFFFFLGALRKVCSQTGFKFKVSSVLGVRNLSGPQ